jgi:ribose 5-phosphate isomerase B
MSIAANKVKGIRCAVVSDEFSAQMSREHNNANVLALGERVIGPGLARKIVKTWLTTEFAGSRHLRRVNKIHALEK